MIARKNSRQAVCKADRGVAGGRNGERTYLEIFVTKKKRLKTRLLV